MAGRDGSIYVIRNLLNGKCYVGQTVNIRHRFAYYRSSLRVKECRRPIERAVVKYGWDSFEKLLFHGIPFSLLDNVESELIERLSSIAPYGYNLDSGGNAQKKQHPDSIRKRSVAMSGDRHPLFGTHLTDEQKKHLSDVWMGRTISSEVRAKISLANRGKVRTPEMIEAMRARMVGKLVGSANACSRGVVCVETGRVFESMRIAAMELDLWPAHIGECCRGRLHTTGGLHWKWAKTEEIDGRRAN